jgi:DNA-binding NarL/FixJ family response regulator
MTDVRSVIEVVVDGEVVSTIEVVGNKKGSVARPEVVVRKRRLDGGDPDRVENGAGKGIDDDAQVPQLTKREVEVLRLIAGGYTTREIAERLFISQKTVRNHLAAVYRKLDARSRTEAVLCSLRLGLVPSRLGEGLDQDAANL